MSSSDQLILADIYESFDRVKRQYPYLFPEDLVTPSSILSEMKRKGIDSWDQIQRFGNLNQEGMSRASKLICVELRKEFGTQDDAGE